VWVIGVDLGGTKTAFGLINPENRIVARRTVPTDKADSPQNVVERIAGLVDELRREAPAEVVALGICTPGLIDAGVVINPVNLPKLANAPLRRMLSERLKLPVELEHDGRAAALGEFHYGAGRDVQSMVHLVLGTGVGGAIFINGKLYRGENNAAGEIGHVTVNPEGDVCQCGSRGCLETYASGPWIARRFQQQIEAEKHQVDEEITGALVARLAAENHPTAKAVMDEAGRALGIAIANLGVLLNIDFYVIGGSVAKAGDVLLQPAMRAVSRYTFKEAGSGIRVVISTLGDDGPILGCGWLARQVIGGA
jgi:glucokinase